jgi:hypothetical protein
MDRSTLDIGPTRNRIRVSLHGRYGREVDRLSLRLHLLDDLAKVARRGASGERTVTFTKLQQHPTFGIAQLGSRTDNGIEHVLEIGRRGGDDAEHLGGGRLLFQCFSEHTLTLCQLGLESHDPRVVIVCHSIHLGYAALLRDGDRVARPRQVGL